MAALHPAVAAVRTAVRRALAEIPPEDPPVVGAPPVVPARPTVLVACSGGADSLALAAATAFVAPRVGLRAGLVTVDHQLQPGSAERAEAVAAWAEKEGLSPVVVATVRVEGRPGGPEAAARQARYEALVRAAHELGAGTVLLGHTRDDQAETVLLALLRGAGLRGLAGMPPRRLVGGVCLVRPLLKVARADTVGCCEVLGLPVWTDPHNADPAFARTRARAHLASLVDSLGPAVVGNLARTAELAAADAAALDELADAVMPDLAGPDRAGPLAVADLAGQPAAVRTRVLHRWALAQGVGGAALSHRHVTALDRLVVAWRGQGSVHLPGGVTVTRRAGWLLSGRAARPDPGFEESGPTGQ